MILLYHRVFPDSDGPEPWCAGQVMTLAVLKRHILWLADHYRIVSLVEYLADGKQSEFKKRKPIALTFDDGFRITFQCVSPFLRENNIPATFFVSTGHLEHGELLWFSYLNALCFEKLYTTVEVDQEKIPLHTLEQSRQAWHALAALAKASGDAVDFSRMLAKTYPIPADKTSLYEGMTYEQLIEAGRSDLLEIGGHTITHPYLDLLSKERQAQEILDCRRTLSDLLGKPIRYFAYPGGEYNVDTIDSVRSAGIEAAFAVIPKHLLDEGSPYEIERIGIYSRSLLKLQMKAMGVAGLARRFGLRVG